MDVLPLLRGVGIGFAIAVPVGPIGLLCIRRTLSQGVLVGVATGLGAATADGLYGCVAGFGLTVISQQLLGWSHWLQVLGGLYLCYLGSATIRADPRGSAQPLTGLGLAGAYGSTFVLTLTNPATILAFIAIFAGLGLAQPNTAPEAPWLLVLGVFGGSALWWLLLSWGVSRLRSQLSLPVMRWLNRLAGAAIVIFGIVALGMSR